MNFDESVKYLYSLGNEVLAMKLGLENPRKLLTLLGKPEIEYLKIQVAGTNGKGSTCAFTDSICQASGIKTGLFTSPHLVSITERIKIGGTEISQDEFASYATIVRNVTESANLYATFFEQITAIALLAFAENCVEVAILETGLGGRLDATTAANAEIIGITLIDFDHQQYLGETMPQIASEKATVIRNANQLVAVSRQNPVAECVILDRCTSFGIVPTRTDFALNSPLALHGKHQIENAKLAVRLAEFLREKQFHISNDAIGQGLNSARHPGRLEYLSGILFDGAHNPAGAASLREYLTAEVSKPITMIFGAMKDKDFPKITEILFPLAEQIIFVEINNPRSLQFNDIKSITKPNCQIIEAKSIAEALAKAAFFTNNQTVVTGSLYLIGEVRTQLLQQNLGKL